MNKLIKYILALGLTLFTGSVLAQVPITPVSGLVSSNTLAWYQKGITFYQGVQTNKALYTSLYSSYAPGLKAKNTSEWGLGLCALYPLNQYTFTGFRGDYMAGSLFAAQAAVGLDANVQIFGVNVTPFIITSVLLPLSGSDNNFTPGNASGGGVTVGLYNHAFTHNTIGVNLTGEAERWTVPGNILDQQIVSHAGLTLNLTF